MILRISIFPKRQKRNESQYPSMRSFKYKRHAWNWLMIEGCDNPHQWYKDALIWGSGACVEWRGTWSRVTTYQSGWHPWRRLKTSGSKRLVRLIGASLEAIKVTHQQGFGTQFLFPSYTSASKCNGNSASAALNKFCISFLTSSYRSFAATNWSASISFQFTSTTR